MITYIDRSHTQHDLKTSPPIKVCIHTLQKSRSQIRTMRGAITLAEAGFAVTIVDVESEPHPVGTLSGACGAPFKSFGGRERMLSGTQWSGEGSVCRSGTQWSRQSERSGGQSERCGEDHRVASSGSVRFKHILMPSWFISTRFKPFFLFKAAWVIICSTLRLLQTPTDIYHVHDELALFPCYIAARLRHKPLIFEAHEFTLSDPTLKRWRRLHALATRLLTHMLPHCAGVIVPSPPIALAMRELYHASNVVVLRNVPKYRTVTKSDRLRQRFGLSPEIRIALYQGNFQKNRGLDRLVRVAPFLEQNIVIVLMGKDFEGIQAQLEALIAEQGVAERVKIIPPVPYAELLDWTASADIGLSVFPPDYSLSIRFCLPNKFSEYLMAGLPVLSSQLDVVAELISTYDVGRVVDSLAPEEIGKAINTLLADEDALPRMRCNALRASQEEFNWDREKEQLISLYQDILTKKEGRSL